VTTDESIVSRIERLLEEEQQLRDAGPDTAPTDAGRITELEVELDRCWDLLRQRRAARDAGVDPDVVTEPRDPAVVETYEQ
jgi:hypothetical protein